MLCVLGGCGGLDDRAAQPTRKTHALTVNVGARLAEQLERSREIPELDADFLEHGLRVVLDQLQALLVQDFDVGDLAVDPCRGSRLRALPRGAFCGAAALAPLYGRHPPVLNALFAIAMIDPRT